MNFCSSRRLIAPLGSLALTLACVWWAFPVGLPLWRSVAIVTAWAGSGLLFSSVILMIREPHLAHLFGGLDTMYRWHHRSGVMAYLLLLAHPLALALAGWSESPKIAWQALSPWTQSWPVWLGWISLILLMAGLVTTFSLRLPYRLWRAFHYFLGVGVIGGLVHIYVLLGEMGPLLALIALVALALAWRLVVSDLGMIAYPYQVAKVNHCADRMVEASLTPCRTLLRATPGQFVLAAFGDGPHYQGCEEFHPFTISGIEDDGSLSISVKALGACTHHIQTLEPGVEVCLQGPFGTFLENSRMAPQLWVAGGVGITPFIATLRHDPIIQPTALIYLYRTKADAAFLDELSAIAETNPEFQLLVDATGANLPDLGGLLKRVNRLPERQIHICGPTALVKALKDLLQQQGLPYSSIHFEGFDFR